MAEHGPGPRETAVDAQGNVFEFVSGQWRPQRAAISTTLAVATGAARTISQIGRGAQQLVGVDTGPDESLQAFQELQQEQPIAAGVGQALPFLATAPFGAGSAGALAATAGVDALLGGLMPGTPQERLTNALFGAGSVLAGGVALNAVQRVSGAIAKSSRAAAQGPTPPIPGRIQAGSTAGAEQVDGVFVPQGAAESPMRTMLNMAGKTTSGAGLDDPSTLLLMERGVELGLKFDPGTAGGSAIARIANAGGRSSIAFADLFDEAISIPNQLAMQKRLLTSLGSDADTFTPNTMGAVQSTLAAERRAIEKAAPRLGVDNQVRTDLQAARADYNKNVARVSQEDPFIKQVDNVIKTLEEQPTITAKDYARMREQLRKAHRSAMTADTNQAFSLQQVIEALDDLFRRNAGPDLADRFNTNTRRFRMLEVVKRPGVLTAQNTINAGSLRRGFDKIFEQEFTFNRAKEFGTPQADIDLFDTTKVLTGFRDLVGDSGTVPRGELRRLFTNPVEEGLKFSLRPVVRSVIEKSQPTLEQIKQFAAEKR